MLPTILKIRVDIFQFQVSTGFFPPPRLQLQLHLLQKQTGFSARHMTSADFNGREYEWFPKIVGFSTQIIQFQYGFPLFSPSILGCFTIFGNTHMETPKNHYGSGEFYNHNGQFIPSWSFYRDIIKVCEKHFRKFLKTKPNESNNFKFIWYPLLWYFDPVQLQGWLMALHAVAW